MTDLLTFMDAAYEREQRARVIAGQMIDALTERDGAWRSAAELALDLDLGLGAGERGKRAVRAGAAASCGRIISGQLGYKLTSDATPAEVSHACAWLERQAQEMAGRAAAQRRVWHASAAGRATAGAA